MSSVSTSQMQQTIQIMKKVDSLIEGCEYQTALDLLERNIHLPNVQNARTNLLNSLEIHEEKVGGFCLAVYDGMQRIPRYTHRTYTLKPSN